MESARVPDKAGARPSSLDVAFLAGETFEGPRLLVFHPGNRHGAGQRARRALMFLGGAALEGPRYIWWNFVSSRRERIEQAKEDWKTGKFAPVPGETEFIPLPDS